VDGSAGLTDTTANTYTGGTTVENAAEAQFDNGGSFGSGPINLNNGELAYIGTAAATVANNISDTATSNNIIDASGQTLTLSGSITNTSGTLTLQDGTFALTGTNGASNNPTFSGGTLQIGNGVSPTTVAQFGLQNNLPASTAGITLDAGTFQFTGSGLNVANSLTLDTAGSSIDLNGQLATWSGPVGGAGSLNVINSSTTAPGILTLTNSTNNYSGSTSIGAATGQNITLAVSGTGVIGNGLLTVNSTGTFDMTAGTIGQTVAGLAGSGAVNLGTNMLTLNLPGASTQTFSGEISSATISGGGLTVEGTGTETFSGNNSYSGVTTINGGDLVVSGTLYNYTTNSGNTLTPGAVNINGGELDVENSFSIGDLNGTGGTLNLGTGFTLIVLATQNDTYSGAITGAGELLFNGGGNTDNYSLTLNGSMAQFSGMLESTNSGNIVISSTAGQLNASVILNVTNNHSITLTYGNINSNAVNFSGNTGTGGLYVTGANANGSLGAIDIATAGTTVNTIDAGGSTNNLTLAGAVTSASSGNTLILQNGTFVLGGTNGAVVNPTFSAGTLELGNGGTATSTIADFASATNLPAVGANILLNGATLAYTGGATNPVTVLNAITIGDAPTTNIIDAGGSTETLSGLLTDTDGSTLILQNGTIVLENSGNSGSFTTGTLQVGSGSGTSEVEFSSAANLPGSTVGISLDDGELAYTGTGTVPLVNVITLTGSGTIAGNGQTVQLDGIVGATQALSLQNGTYDLNGTGITVGQLNTDATTTIINSSTTTQSDITITPDAMATPTASTISGNIDGGTGAGILLTLGSGSTTGTAVTSTISGTLSGNLALIFTGVDGNAGLTDTTANTYTGGTTVENAAEVQFDNGGSFGSGTITLNNGELAYIGTVAATVSNNISDAATSNNVIDAGGQALTLNGNITNASGTLTLQNGTIDLTGTNNTTFTSGTLRIGNGTGTSTVVAATNAELPNTAAGTTVVLALDQGALDYSGGGTLNNNINILDNGTNASSNIIDVGGTSVTLAGSITNASALGDTLALQDGTITLTGTNDTTFTSGTLQIGGGTNLAATAEFAAQTDLPASTVALILDNGDMQFDGNGLNINNTSITVDSTGGSFDIHGNTGSTISGSIAINGLLTLENTATGGGGVITLTGANSGSGGVNVDSGLTVNFNNTSSFGTGTVTLAAADDTLQYAASVAIANALDVANAGTIDVAGNTGTWSGNISGTGALTLNTSTAGGELILTGNNSNLTGGVSVENGLLVNFNNNNALGDGEITIASTGGTLQYATATNNLNMADNLDVLGAGTIDVNGNNHETWSGQITGNGALTLNDSTAGGTGKLFLTGDNVGLGGGVTVENALTVNFNNNNALGDGVITIASTGGTLQYGANGLNIADALDMLGAGTIDVAGNSNETWSGPISGAGALTLNTSTTGGKLFLSGNNSNLSGGVTVENGLTVNFDNTVSSTSNFGSRAVTIAATGGVLQYGAANLTVGNSLVLGNTGANVAALDANGNTGTWSGIISGSGALTLTSSAANGVLILNGVNTYTGATNVQNGVTAVAGNSNAFGAAATTDILTVSGTGSAVDSINSYNLSQNKLLASATGETINLGGYTQNANTTLNLVALGRPAVGTYDSLNLGTGAVQLAGTLNLAFSTVVNSTFRPADFDQYTIVTTTGSNSGVTGAGTLANTSVEHGGSTYGTGWLNINPTSTNLDLNYYEADPNGNETVTIQTLFLPDAQTPNEQAVATYIDQYVNPSNVNVPANMQSALANLSLQSPGEIALLLNGLTPQAYAGLADEAFQNSTFLNQEIFTQVQQEFQAPGFNNSGLTLLKTSDQNPFAISMESQMQSAQQQAKNSVAYMDSAVVGYPEGYIPPPSPATAQSRVSGFVLGTVTIDQLHPDGASGQHFTTGGVLAGMDYRLNQNLVIGISFNCSYTGGMLDNAASMQQSMNYTPGVFAGYQKGNIYADALASYSYNSYRIDRNVNIGGSASTATGKPTGNQFDAAAFTGYWFPVSTGLKISPAVGVGYTHLDISSFSETGSPFDLSVGSQSVNSLRSLLGGQLAWTIFGKHNVLTNSTPAILNINFNAFWQHEFLNSNRNISANFSGLGSGSFIFQTNSPSRDSALLGGGINGNLSKGVTVFANYEIQAGTNNQFAQTIMAGVAVNF
jgi:autotransporter-associated beta strand protein